MIHRIKSDRSWRRQTIEAHGGGKLMWQCDLFSLMRIDRLKLQLNKIRLPGRGTARGPGSMQVILGSYESWGEISRGNESDLLLLKE